MIPFETDPLLQGMPFVKHGFFGRRGGVSKDRYDSLNCGPGSEDDPHNVSENRARVAHGLSVPPKYLCSLWQHHSADCLILDGPLDGQRPKADAMATKTPGLALGILTADCGPVLLADPEAGVIGAAHAGWRGAIGGITDSVIEAMEHLGASADNIRAVIGPCIGKASYEVGPEFVAEFLAQSPDHQRFFEPGNEDRSLFALKDYITHRLIARGVSAVTALADDTYAAPERYFSHRYNVHHDLGDYGRNISAIVMDSS